MGIIFKYISIFLRVQISNTVTTKDVLPSAGGNYFSNLGLTKNGTKDFHYWEWYGMECFPLRSIFLRQNEQVKQSSTFNYHSFHAQINYSNLLQEMKHVLYNKCTC